MAKNIVLKDSNGVPQTYENISTIILKDDQDNDVTFVEQTSGGGDNTEMGTRNRHIKVIDYDGTVLDEKWLKTGDTYTFPKVPKHERLVFQEWSCSQGVVAGDSIVIGDSDVMAGAIYTSASGMNEFDITLTKVTGLNVSIKVTGQVDWGDGTIETIYSSPATHTYTEYGDYTIKAETLVVAAYIFGQSSNANYYCTRAILTSTTSINTYAFYMCRSLHTITIPNTVRSIGGNAYQGCYALKALVMPKSVTSVGESLFSNCYSLESVVIPYGPTSLGLNFFSGCKSLTYIAIPDSVKMIGNSAFSSCSALTSIDLHMITSTIGNSAFDSCSSLKSIIMPNECASIGTFVFSFCYTLKGIVIPRNITSIGNSAFQSCTNLIKYDFTSLSSVPTLDGTFLNISAITKIYVPDALYNEWIVATNWVTYADYIYKASEMEANNG